MMLPRSFVWIDGRTYKIDRVLHCKAAPALTMIQYKNGRLHIPGISFSIPEGFYFYTEVDSVSDNNLHFLSPDQSYSLNYQATSSVCGSPQKDLELMIRDTGSHPRQNPTPIIVNGLKGCYAIYGGGDELYYELRIQNPDDRDEYEQLIILIMCNEHTDIMSIIESDVFKAVVNDIRPE